MKLGRPFICVGNCIAVRLSRGKGKGEPLLGSHPSVIFDGEKWSAYRLSYHLNVAPISRTPPNMKEDFVLHTCDHGWCVKPGHLYLGTQAQNVSDMFARSDAKKKLSAVGQGRRHSSETKSAIRAAHLGKAKTEKHCSNISTAKKKFFADNPGKRDMNSAKARQFWIDNPELMKRNMGKMREARPMKADLAKKG